MNAPLAVEHCWDRLRDHHGPCCMECVIEETNRRAGVPLVGSVRETQLRRNGYLVAVVRACCHHLHWQEEAVTEAATREHL